MVAWSINGQAWIVIHDGLLLDKTLWQTHTNEPCWGAHEFSDAGFGLKLFGHKEDGERALNFLRKH